MATKKSAVADDAQAQARNPDIDIDAAWSMVVEAGDIEDYDKLKVLLTGATKKGKSHCASLFEKPLYGLTEKQAVLTIKRSNPRAKIFFISTAADLFSFKQMAKQASSRGFDAVVLDSITDAQRILRGFYTARQGAKAGRDKTSQESWGSIIDATARLAREMRDLPIHVCVIALDEEVHVDGVGIVHRPLVSGKKLPNDLLQYFSCVGHLQVMQQDRGYRHEVIFRADERYLVGGPHWLDDVMPPEPRLWISRMTGAAVPPDVQKRVDAWHALSNPEGADEADKDDKDDADDSAAA